MARTVEGGGYRGRGGMEKYLVERGDAWEEHRVLVDEFRDLGDRVLVLSRQEGRGRGSACRLVCLWQSWWSSAMA